MRMMKTKKMFTLILLSGLFLSLSACYGEDFPENYYITEEGDLRQIEPEHEYEEAKKEAYREAYKKGYRDAEKRCI